MNLRCAIIDDEPLALGLLESYVRKLLPLNFADATQAPFKPCRHFPSNLLTYFFWTFRCLN